VDQTGMTPGLTDWLPDRFGTGHQQSQQLLTDTLGFLLLGAGSRRLAKQHGQALEVGRPSSGEAKPKAVRQESIV
jgi:hypothetical protein